MAGDIPYRAVVVKIIRNGPHGPYAVAQSKKLGSVTFSLNPETWRETDWPEKGDCVWLDKVRLQENGWRAKQASFVKP